MRALAALLLIGAAVALARPDRLSRRLAAADRAFESRVNEIAANARRGREGGR